MSQEFDNNVLDLINQKGFYPYDYMSYFEKFKKEFPQKEKFCGSLTDRKISDKEYEHVLKWNIFEMKTLKDYHDLYSKYEVLLLAFVFEKFRNNNFMDYGLCPGHYLSVLGLSWDAMRRKTKLSLDFFQILTCIYSLKKAQEVVFLIFLIDTAKPTINI